MNQDSRYPYTYAADAIPEIAGYKDGSTKLSRSDAAQIQLHISNTLGIDDEDLAKLIADKYKEKYE